MLKASTSSVRRIGQMFVIKDTLNRKVSSGRPRASKIEDDHRLKMNVLKSIRKHLLSTAKINYFSRLTKPRRVMGKEFLSKICGKNVFCGQQTFSLTTVILSLWSSFIVEAPGRPKRNFLFNVPLIPNRFLILFTAERNVFTFFLFQNSACKSLFPAI